MIRGSRIPYTQQYMSDITGVSYIQTCYYSITSSVKYFTFDYEDRNGLSLSTVTNNVDLKQHAILDKTKYTWISFLV